MQKIIGLFLFALLLLSLFLWHCMRPNCPFLSTASNANLKPDGLLKWKMWLVKNVRLLLPLIGVMKIVRLTSLLLDMPRLSPPQPKLTYDRRHALLSLPNLCILFFVLSLALPPPYLPPPLTSPTVPLPGSRLRSFPTT